MSGKYKTSKNQRPKAMPYSTMPIAELLVLPVRLLAAEDAHLWLWTTNQFLEEGFALMRAWGFKYLAPIHAVKPSGIGNYFVHLSQTLLFGYRGKCRFPLGRYKPNVIEVGSPERHSAKWESTYQYIEAISPAPRVELFARRRREGWDAWGNEIESNVELMPQKEG